MKFFQSIKNLLRPLFDYSSFIFPFALIFYLLLFLLENLFPGFVGHSMDLNLFLIPVFIFGFFATFSPLRQDFVGQGEEEKAKKSDYVLIAFLTILVFVVLMYKTYGLGIMGFWTSIAGATLIAFVSIVMLIMPNQEKDEEKVLTEAAPQKYQSHNFSIHFVGFFRKRVFIPALCFVLLVSLILIGYKYYGNKVPKKDEINNKSEAVVISRAEQVYQNLEEESMMGIDFETLKNNPINVMDNNISSATLSAVIMLLQENRVAVSKIVKSDGYFYNDVTVRFAPQNLSVAEYLVRVLKDRFPHIEKVPQSSDSAETTLVLTEKK